jgi:serine/threonine protein kinase
VRHTPQVRPPSPSLTPPFRLRHPNIVTLVGVCTNPVAVLTEFMARGTLFAILADTAIAIAYPLKLQILLDIARGTPRTPSIKSAGMQFLHASGFIHRDLKSLNVLVTDAFM